MLWMSHRKHCGEEQPKNFQGRDKFKMTGRKRAAKSILRSMNNLLLSEQGCAEPISQPTCWRKRQGFGKNIMISIHPSPMSTPQMTPGNSWAKSKFMDSHCRKSHVVAFSSSLSFSLNHTVPTFLQLKAALWITAPFSNVPLVFPEQKRLHT